MLTPEYLENLPDRVVKLWQKAEDDILKDVARRIGKMDGITDTAAWQLWRLEQAGLLKKDVVSVISRYSGKSEKLIADIIRQACTDSLLADDRIYRAAGKDVPDVNSSPALSNLLNAGYRQTVGTWKNITATTADTVTKQFEDALDNAWLQVASGAFDYKTAIKRCVDKLAVDMKYITYPTGHRDTLEVAVRRAVLTGVNQTAGKLSMERAIQMECDLVEVTAHAGARPSHADWQGRVYSRSGRHPKYPPFSRTGYGSGAGLCGWNCRHSFYPFFEGLSKPAYSKAELDSYNKKEIEYNGKLYTRYEISQMQRELERKVRKAKRRYLARKRAGTDTTREAVRLKGYRQRLKEFAYRTGGRIDSARTSAIGFGRSEAGKAAWDVRRVTVIGPQGQIIYRVKNSVIKWNANSITQVATRKGGITRNYYGNDGRQIKQISNNGHGHKREEAMGFHGEHAHDYIYENGKLVERLSRELTQQEREENSDIL